MNIRVRFHYDTLKGVWAFMVAEEREPYYSAAKSLDKAEGEYIAAHRCKYGLGCSYTFTREVAHV